ncbi:MAG TPA: hypothetical protein VGI66_16190 [Streptosporangiaceae bacterium]
MPGSANPEQPVLDGKNGSIDQDGREAFGRCAQPWGSPTAWWSWPANYASCLEGDVIPVSGQHP